MADKKTKQKPSITPLGVSSYSYLDKPDVKFKPEGEFKTNLTLSAADAAPIVARIDSLMERLRESEEVAELEKKRVEWNKKNAKLPKKQVDELQENTPYQAAVDDSGEETGEVVFKFSSKASGEYKTGKKTGEKWERKLDVFDAKKNKIKGAVWSGSKIKVAYTTGEYVATVQIGYGIKLYLEAVQVIDLVQGGERNADGYGFGEEDGYEAAADADKTGEDAGSDDNSSEGGEGGADDSTDF